MPTKLSLPSSLIEAHNTMCSGYLLEQESYRYESDFGEQNTNNRKPRLFVLNVAMATDECVERIDQSTDRSTAHTTNE